MHRVVIVGGGAGGLELATKLGDTLGRRRQAEITLVERARTHFWKPHLHELAAGSMDVRVYETDYLAQSHWHCFRYRIGEMRGLDRKRRAVEVAPFVDEDGDRVTSSRIIEYDTLVIAVGSRTNDFGTPGAREFAIALDDPAEAGRFHRRLVNAYIRAHAQAEPLRPEQLQVAIIGAGATGVELAAELHNTTRTLVSYGLDRIDPDKDMRLILIEAADRVLPALPQRIADAALRLLENMRISVRTSALVAEVLPNGVRLASGEVIP
ncbi:MAG TPA: FAD-dependent oxidoreductase, partial [Casimicrobiaceae bacterium]|nr:FAD-dependent oxidoreductase [Casimicrobiaceae bacterium]